MIRVLVIDDSAFMRKVLSLMIDRTPDMEVIGTACDGTEGFHKTLELRPDLVTLDIEMPRTNGLECIKMIMATRPTPILVVSSLTTHGAETTLQALNLGALDYIPKAPSQAVLEVTRIEADLVQKITVLAGHFQRQRRLGTVAGESPQRLYADRFYDLAGARIACVAIGASTGGPPVLQRLLTALPADFPHAILVAQHMPAEFTAAFARRLDTLCRIHVKEVETGEVPKPGTAYIGRGGEHLTLQQKAGRIRILSMVEPAEVLYHPSVDLMLASVAQIYGSRALGLILTGMGKDGLAGSRELKARQGIILAQSEASSVVYGMPKAVVDAGLATDSLGITGLIESLKSIKRHEGVLHELS